MLAKRHQQMYLTDMHGRVVVRRRLPAIWFSVSVSTTYMQNRCLLFAKIETGESASLLQASFAHFHISLQTAGRRKTK